MKYVVVLCLLLCNCAQAPKCPKDYGPWTPYNGNGTRYTCQPYHTGPVDYSNGG